MTGRSGLVPTHLRQPQKRQRPLRRLSAGVLVAAVAGPLLGPAVADAHGLVGKAVLPVPAWLFGWAAAAVLILSFVALSALWSKPRLQEEVRRPLVPLPSWLIAICGAIGVALLVAVVYSGFEGNSDSDQNLAPAAIYVIFWVGVPVLSAVFGDFFRAFNPWRAVALAGAGIARVVARRPVRAPFAYPEWLGRWPAALGVLGFAWLELIYVDKDIPSRLAALTVAYVVIQLAGMGLFGIDAWSDRGDAFGTLFNLYSRLSPLERNDGRLCVRRPLSGAPQLPTYAGTVGLLCVAIGSTTFDGLSNGPVWASLKPDLQSFFGTLGANPVPASELAGSVGLLASVLLVTAIYRLGVQGMTTVDREHKPRELGIDFAHTLIPIAFAYALAHYFSLLVFQGQAIGYLISNPLGNGSNIFGTAKATIDLNVVSTRTIWYVQVAALVCGHVAGLVLAHDRAIAIYRRPRDATASQYWMLVVMVGFTSLGLWLLSAVNS